MVEALLGAGILKASTGTVSTTIALESDDATALTAQLGLGDIGLFPESGPMNGGARAHRVRGPTGSRPAPRSRAAGIRWPLSAGSMLPTSSAGLGPGWSARR